MNVDHTRQPALVFGIKQKYLKSVAIRVALTFRVRRRVLAVPLWMRIESTVWLKLILKAGPLQTLYARSL